VVAPGVDPSFEDDRVALILGAKLATGVRAGRVGILRDEVGAGVVFHGHNSELVGERRTTERELLQHLKATSPNDRVNPRFVLTVNLDIELDRANGVRYIPSVHEDSVTSPRAACPTLSLCIDR
jgi:hypothetical protein